MVLNAKYLMWKTSGNVFSGHIGGSVFHIFPRLHSIIRKVRVDPQYLLEFLWIMLHYSVQTRCNIKMELMAGNCCHNCCYIELRLEYDRAPRSDSKMHR